MRTFNKKLSGGEKYKLKTICKILFPEYKKVKLKRKNRVILSRRSVTTVKRRETFEFVYLMDYIIPLKLSLFKYNNEQFIAEIYAQRTRSLLKEESQLSFYYDQIIKLKISNEIEEKTIFSEDESFSVEDRGKETFYYILNERIHTTKDIIIDFRNRVIKFFRPIYYETVSLVIITISFYIILKSLNYG